VSNFAKDFKIKLYQKHMVYVY